MVIKNVVRGIASVLILISIALIVMGTAPGINVTSPSPGATVNVNYVNVTVTTTGTTGTVILDWGGTNFTMSGSGNEFYLNKTELLNNVYNYIVYADNGTGNWSNSSNRTVTVNAPPSITAYEPAASSVTSMNGIEQKFNITVDQDATGVSWKIDGNEVFNSPVAHGVKSEYSNSTTLPGTHNVTAVATNAYGSSSTQTWSWTVNSPTLGTVSGLSSTRGSTWIHWTWTNPGVPFNHTIVRINGTFQTNTSGEFYNYDSFSPGTLNTISLQTVDTSGNIYPTPTENQSSTYNTQTGANVPVQLTSNLKVTYTQVTTEGNTTVNPVDSLLESETQPTFLKIGKYYYIGTEALVFTAPIKVELNYTPPTGVNESNIKLYHWEGSWVDRTTSIDIANDRITGSINSFSPVVLGAPPIPTITKVDPTGGSVETIGKESKTFKITVDQDANITWYFDGSSKNSSSVLANIPVEYTYTPSSTGNYTFSVKASNINGETTATWNWTVRSKTYKTGNRVWDENKDMSLQYTWNPMSFYAFYYDVNDNVGSESLEINLDSKSDRSIERDDLIYRTTTDTVSFKFKGWGSYKVIGFMADKYFAAYTASTSTDITKGSPVSTIGYSQLHRVLMDDKDSHTVRTSTTYPLGDGYAVTLKDIGAGRLAWISILKDGGEVYSDFASENGTLVYSKKVGSVNDLPLIAIHVKNVFMGTTDNAVFIDGIFQISESYTSASSSNRYGIMEITDTSETGITMKNRNSFTLSSGSTIDIMGDMKFIVAKNDKLRFAPMIKRSGEYEVRGSISDNETDNEWTPLNFEGFYYNLDEDVGTEKLTLTRSGRTVAKDALTYNTSAQQVSFKYNGLGKYYVIGFMADKYFAGYIGGGAITTDDISTIEHNQLHKVEIDDDTQRIIYAGSTLTLNDGYVIKIKDVNMGAGTPSVWLTVLKDGNEVFDDFKEKGQVFIYSKDVGAVKNLPLISLRIENIFRGKEATAAFVKGTFQIDEAYTSVNNGDKFDKMEVTEITKTSIKMTNPNTVTLSSASTVDLMKNIKFKVADSSDIRFYPYILVNGSALASNQLAIGVPPSMMVKDTISISVTSGTGTPQDNAEVSFDGTVIGSTNSTGKLDYMLTKAGQHNLTATKLGYEKAIKTIQIAEYVDNRLNFELPEFIDQYIPVSIKIRVSGSGNVLSGANITLDGTGIGATDSSGVLTYTFTASGKHNLAASKSGYISVHREIDVRMPFIEFKALDINFRPDVVAKGQNVYIWSNITNSGTKEGTLPVALIINSTVVENSNVTLAPGKYGRVNFSRKIDLLPGNYTVEILGQKTTMPVKEEPLNLFLVAGLITGLGVIAVYFLTSKNLMSVEALKSKMNMETVNRIAANAKSNIQDLASKLTKKGGKGGMVPPKYDPFSKFNK